MAPPARRSVCVATAVLGAALAVPATAEGPALIVRKGGPGTAALAEALGKALAAQSPQTVELTGDVIADSARLARDAGTQGVIFAIGPDATDAAGTLNGPSVVSMAVPNPARLRTAGTYLSIYPRLERVFAWTKGSLGARRLGLLFSPAQNREIALQFLKAAAAQGVTLEPVPVNSAGDLIRDLDGALPKVDALLLAVDPILFDRQALKFIVDKCTAEKKATVGFLEDLPKLGVTAVLVTPPAAVAAMAAQAAQEKVTVGKKRIEVDGATIIVSRKAATAIGLNPEALGATRVE